MAARTPRRNDVADRDVYDRDVDRIHDGVTFQEEIVRSKAARIALAALRLVLGFTFLWPFLDKLFGLGYGTAAERAWVNGGSPTTGFLTKNETVVNGPFGSFFANFAGGVWDYLFMAGLLGIGVAVLLGAGLKIAAISGTILLGLMYLAEFPIGRPGEGFTNPIFDSHWIEALGLIVLATTLAGDTWGLGKWWGRKVGDGILR
ncbi:DoxX family protein [Actinomycetota bacterium]